MPNGKPAGTRCIQLNDNNQCIIFGMPKRPSFCSSLQPNVEMCGDEKIGQSRVYAMTWLTRLEMLTRPN